MPTFLTSKRFLSPSVLAPALAVFVFAGGASAMSTSAMVARCVEVVGCAGRRRKAMERANGGGKGFGGTEGE